MRRRVSGIIVSLCVICKIASASPSGVETRWASPENRRGEKGAIAHTNGGRKGRPSISIKAGERATLPEAHGSSGTVRRIWGHIQ